MSAFQNGMEQIFEEFQLLDNRSLKHRLEKHLFTEQLARETISFHRTVPGYAPSSLLNLDELARQSGICAILVKDESTRFDLKAFKGLGGSYAMFRILCERLGPDPKNTACSALRESPYKEKCSKIHFVTATDGNHGKGISWAARIFGCQASVYMPAGTVESRRRAIEEAGNGKAEITEWNYDDTVAYAARMAEESGWILIQDTSWEGYEKYPKWIADGYLTMVREIKEQAGNLIPTHVFLQAGVGSMAGAVLDCLTDIFSENPPIFTIVEPRAAACFYRSARDGGGKAQTVDGNPETIMAGLNCGTPSMTIWPVIRDQADFFFACDDEITRKGMRRYAHPLGTDLPVVAGESGAVTLGAALEILEREALRELYGINEQSVILVINTEGDTDPDDYRLVVGGKAGR